MYDGLVLCGTIWLPAGTGMHLEANAGGLECTIPSLHSQRAMYLHVRFHFESHPQRRKPLAERPYYHRPGYELFARFEAYLGRCNPQPRKIPLATRRELYPNREE